MIRADSGFCRDDLMTWCENNGVAQYSGIEDIFPFPQVSGLADGFGIPRQVVDGQDLFACGAAARGAIARMRAGEGPQFVECMTLRPQEHNVGGLNMEGTRKRDPATLETWLAERNPLTLARAQLLDAGIADDETLDAILEEARAQAEALRRTAEAGAKAMPPVSELEGAVYAR